jgi:hypothetical protein
MGYGMKSKKWDFDDWFFYGAIIVTATCIVIAVFGYFFIPESANKLSGNGCKSHISACVAVGTIAVPVYSNECD